MAVVLAACCFATDPVSKSFDPLCYWFPYSCLTAIIECRPCSFWLQGWKDQKHLPENRRASRDSSTQAWAAHSATAKKRSLVLMRYLLSCLASYARMQFARRLAAFLPRQFFQRIHLSRVAANLSVARTSCSYSNYESNTEYFSYDLNISLA